MKGWENFFAAQIGAAAALVGLIFVGVSINAQKTGKIADVPPRVRQAFTAMIAVLFESIVLLIPGQPVVHIGIAMLAVGVFVWIAMGIAVVRVWQTLPRQYRRGYSFETGALLLATAAFLYVIYAMITGGNGNSVIWTVPGIILYYAATIFDAWLFLRISVFDH